jgi:hypothetical protein
MLAERARPEIEPLLRAELGPDLAMEWGASHYPGTIDIVAILGRPAALERHCGRTAYCMRLSWRRKMVTRWLRVSTLL